MRTAVRAASVLRVRILAPLALLAAIAAVVVFFLAGGKADEPDAIARYVAAWSRGDDRAAAALTDRPAAAKQALQASRAGLDGASVRARVRSRDEDGAHVDVAWNVPRFGRFAYTIRLTTKDGKIHWRERAVHPALGRRTRLGTATEAPKRAPILDRDGRPLVTDRAVVDIAVKAGEARSDTADRLAAAIDDVDAGPLARRIREAPKGRFLPVITLRAAAFRKVEETVTAIPGVTLNRTTAPLAPTSEFARPLLGTVGPATAEQIAESRGRLATGDVAGQSGLERLYDERLAGTSTRRVIVRERADGAPVRTLDKRGGGRGKALQTRLDLPTQTAAEAALEGVKKGALVAVQPSSGDVLAVANRPSDDYDRALLGRYPPGSTFKVVSTAALLRDGLDPAATVNCPATRTIDGKSFRNFEGSAAGPVPFSVDFAQSCNTAFVSLAGRLRRSDLTEVARAFGLGEKVRAGVPVAGAQVPPPRDEVSHAAMMIGQDRILASPLAMAGVAATVADGRWRAPRVLSSAPERAGDTLDDGVLGTLRTLMRAVVTSGTGTALAGLPGEIRGKSGTAEYGGGDPPPTHAWFIAIRGDLAVAVLVEGGESGGRVAAPVARRFFEALG